MHQLFQLTRLTTEWCFKCLSENKSTKVSIIERLHYTGFNYVKYKRNPGHEPEELGCMTSV